MRDEDRALLRGERALPGLSLLLDDEAFAATLAERLPAAGIASAHGTYVRYEPGRSCLVLFRLQTAAGESLAYATAEPPGGEEALAAARLRAVPGSALGRSALVLAGSRVVVRAFPFDRRLRRLPDVVAGARAGALEVLAYKPERHAVLRARSAGLVLKVHRADRFHSAAATNEALRPGRRLRLPQLVRTREHRGLLAYEWLEGRRLDELLAAGEGVDVAPELAAALAELHAQRPLALPVRYARVEAERLAAGAAATAVAGPAAAREAARLVVRLSRELAGAPATAGAVHGDLSVGRVLVRRSAIALLDLDRAAIGDPAADVADCLADLELRALDGRLAGGAAGAFGEALLDACRREGLDLPDARIGPLTAAALLRRAADPFRHRRPDWGGLIEAAVRRCGELAAGGSDPFRPRGDLGGLTPRAGAAHAGMLSRLPPLLRAIAVLPAWCGDDRSGAPALLLRRTWPRPDGRLLLEYAARDGSVLGAQWLPAELAGSADPRGRLPVVPCGVGGVLVLHVDGRDARLPGLRHLRAGLGATSPGPRVVAGHDATLLSHAPGRRATMRIDDATFAKVVRPSSAAAVTAAARFADRLDGRAFAVADVRWCDPERGIVAVGVVPGRPFGSLLEEPAALPAAFELGAALATLHRAPAPAWLPPHDHAEEARLVATCAERAGRHLPEAHAPLLARAAAAAARLARLPDLEPAPVHRRLHDGQVLVDGGRVGLLDFDALAAGDPARDLGDLLVHFDLLALQGSCTPARAAELASALLAGHGDDGAAARAAAYAHSARIRLACVHALRPRWSHLWRPLSEGPGHAEALARSRADEQVLMES